jgi:glycosyltransferase involved in cell wall biosynthesis
MGARVLLVGPLGTPPLLGGVENGVHLLLRSQLAADVSMQVFNTGRAHDPTRPLREKLMYQLGACGRFIVTLITVRPRVVHVKTSSGVNFYQNALFVLIARLLGRKVVLQLHSGGFPHFFDSAGWLGRRLIRIGLGLPHMLIALSEGWAQYFRQRAASAVITVVGNAVSTSDYRDAVADRAGLGIPADRTALLFVSTRTRNLDVDKGLPELIRAIAIVRRRRPELLLVVAGPVSHAAELEASLGSAGDGWVSLGVVPPEQKPTVYRSVDLFALPSHYENMPNSLLEAMASGLPVIATPVGAIPEMVADEESGLLVSLRDEHELAERIERLVADPSLRRRLGERAASTAAREYDFAVLEERLRDAYIRVGGSALGAPNLSATRPTAYVPSQGDS